MVPKGLEEAGVELLGTQSKTIDLFEDRDEFYQLLDRLEIPRVKGETAADEGELLNAVESLGYPVLIRPSYVIGGLNMVVIRNSQELTKVLHAGKIQYPILVDQYLEANEAELDLAADGEHILIPAIIEHVEKTGVHSGDSFCIIPARSFTTETKQLMAEYAKKIVKEINYKGLMNIQFIVKGKEVLLLEINPRSSRTMPIVSKVAGVELVKKATKILLGKYFLSNDEIILDSDAPFTCVKHPVFSNFALKGLDAKTGPQMISTGEGISIAASVEEALNKGFHSISGKAVQGSIAFADKEDLKEVGKQPGTLKMMEFEIVEDYKEVSALYCPGTTTRDIALREWAIKNRKIVLTQKETLYALLNSASGDKWNVKALGEWLKETSEEVMAK